MTSTISEPKLAPPGAGLPKIELVIARTLTAFRTWSGNHDSFTAQFLRERQAIDGLLADCDEASGGERVLIKRVAGLEDSSRFWSVWMTLDHLRIVNGQICGIITSLAEGISPGGKADTAAVKPSLDADGSVVAGYDEACDDLVRSFAVARQTGNDLSFAHPWFGSLTTKGWHSLAGGHMAIHRVQLQRILEGLRVAGKSRGR